MNTAIDTALEEIDAQLAVIEESRPQLKEASKEASGLEPLLLRYHHRRVALHMAKECLTTLLRIGYPVLPEKLGVIDVAAADVILQDFTTFAEAERAAKQSVIDASDAYFRAVRD